MRHGIAFSSQLRKWCEAKGRPIQGNSPNDRIRRGPDCHRHKRVCVDFFPTTPLPLLPEFLQFSGMRFFRQGESIGPMWSSQSLKAGAGVPPPVGRRRSPAKERDGRSASCPSSAMSSTGYSLIGLLASRARLRFTGTVRITCGRIPENELSSNGNCVFSPVSHRRGAPHLSALISVYPRPNWFFHGFRRTRPH